MQYVVVCCVQYKQCCVLLCQYISTCIDVILGGPLWDYHVLRYDVMGTALVMKDGVPMHCAKIIINGDHVKCEW